MKIEETIIEEEIEGEEKPQKKKRRSRKPKIDVSYEEIQQKLVRIFNLFASLLKSDKKYAEKDFIEESKDLARLSQKYDFIATILTILDPLFLLAGFFTKISDMLNSRKKVEKAEKNENTGDKVNQRVVNLNRSGVIE